MSNTLKYILIVGSLVFIACVKNADYVPNVPVNIDIYPNLPTYSALNTIGGWMYINGGVRGIIVYRTTFDQFIALERNCTFDPSEECATVEVDPSNIFVIDPCCGSQFLLMNGQVSNPPANFPLKEYNTNFDGNMLHIYNF